MVDAKESGVGLAMSMIENEIGFGLELDPKTAGLLTRFARRRRRLLILRAIAAGILFLVVSMMLVAACDYFWVVSDPVRWLLSLLAYGVAAGAMWWFGIRRVGSGDPRRLARQLEAVDPTMREDLLAAVELADPSEANGSFGFRRRLQLSVAGRAKGIDIGQLLPFDLIIRWLIGGIVMLSVCAILLFVPRMQFGRRIARALMPGLAIQRASLTKLEIIKPSPPSGFVAEGDAVGVTVRVTGARRDDIWLQWRTDDSDGETSMTPRVMESEKPNDGTLGHQGIFSANVSVGSIPLQYRVLAGDAITLWQELKPLPRPRVTSFSTRYVFPEYAALSERVETSEHGDLKALVGTMAYVTVDFDQPVIDVSLRYGSQGATSTLDPVEGSDRSFLASIPIRTPGTYQIQAVSAESGLDNPFSPQYSVTPIVDTPPNVRWSEWISESLIVSPLDVIPLSAQASDDLPMERVIHEYQVNDQVVQRQPLKVEDPVRELNLSWDWDLLQDLVDGDEKTKLRGGDIVRMRLVAIDRNGQRGETKFVELLIADEGFDTKRHLRLMQMRQWAESVTEWTDRSCELMNQMKLSAETSDWQTINRNVEDGLAIVADFGELENLTRDTLAGSRYEAEAATIELVGRALQDHRLKVENWFHEAGLQKDSEKTPELIRLAQQISVEGSRIEQLVRATLAEYLTTAVVADSQSLVRSLVPLTSQTAPLPADRFPRYLMVTVGRLQEIGTMIADFGNLLPESTNRQLEVWTRMKDQWTARFQDLLRRDSVDTNAATVAEFEQQLRGLTAQSMVDGRLSPTIVSMTRDLRFQIAGTGDQIFAMDQIGRQEAELRSQAQMANDSERIADLNQQALAARTRYLDKRDQLLTRISREEWLHRGRPKVDLQYAADLELIRRAIENVTAEGYQPYKQESAALVHQKIARACQVIEADHEVNQWLQEVRALLLLERQLDENTTTKILHPTWIERLPNGLDWPMRTIQNFGLAEVGAGIGRVRYSDAFHGAKARMTKRRWSGEPMLSAENSIDELQQALAKAIQPLQIPVIEGRETIEQYVLDLAELARQAAAEAREAEAANQNREDSNKETAEALQAEHEEAVETTEQTIESLVDYANTVDLSDREQRELARDADAAAAKIQADLQRAEQAMKDAEKARQESDRSEALDEAARAMNDLAESLEETASHFEDAKSGENLDESRQALRDAEAALQMQQEMQDPYDRTEALAETSQLTPQELLEQLEQELQTNQPMQGELSEIARQAAENAARSLENSAREERNLNQTLQRSDGAFQEQKRQMAAQLSDLANRTKTVNDSLLQATERAIGWANAPEWRPKLDQARKELNDATQNAAVNGGENAVLSQLEQAAAQMEQAVKNAADTLAEVNQLAEEAQQDDLHADEAGRKRASDQLERFMRDARATQLRAANQETQRWSISKREAARRVQAAQRQIRAVEDQKTQMEDRMKREPDNAEALSRDLDAIQQRSDEFRRVEQAARESVDFADRMLGESRQRGDELKKQSIPRLEKSNPAAEMAAEMTAQADKALDAIREDLKQLASESGLEKELRVPPNQAQNLASQQSRIAGEVDQAVEQLRRAARHEQRLGREMLAEQLEEVADSVEKRTADAVQSAVDAIERAGEDNQQTPAANSQIALAAEAIQQAAEQVDGLFESSMPQSAPAESTTAENASQQEAETQADEGLTDRSTPNQSQPGQSQPGQSQQAGQELARMLDELDRVLNQSVPKPAGESQRGPASESQAGEQGSGQPNANGEQKAGNQPQDSGQASEGESPTAGESSPTLSDALAQQAQDAARQRGQQLQGETPASGEAPSQDQSASSSDAATEPGSGNMPNGGFVDTQGVDRLGDEWGQLRKRRTEDASESRGATIAPQYRREIEAYFRALAKQAAESKEQN